AKPEQFDILRGVTTGLARLLGRVTMDRPPEGTAMAEYVRRKRPPATHPYWARLYDRAHPPPVVLPVAIPASAGLVLGLSAGLHDPFPSGDAARVAVEVAGGSAGVLFFVAVLVLRLDASRQARQREQWAGALVSGIGVSVAMFAVVFVAAFLALLWYATCSGQ